jgi:Bacterial Ig-like domain
MKRHCDFASRLETQRSRRRALVGVLCVSLIAGAGCGRGKGARSVVIVQGGRPTMTAAKQRPPRPPRKIQIKVHEDPATGNTSFEVLNLKDADLDKLTKANLTEAQWQALFSVSIQKDAAAASTVPLPLLGSYRLMNKKLVFLPRYPPQHGLQYQAVFNLATLPEHRADEKPVTAHFTLARKHAAADTVVAHVYPSTDKLPENQLKFYLHFSAPMSRGEAYRHVHLLDESGKEVELPFLELDEELWDPAGKRFTLFFDPGRIKRGLKPREEVGPALVEGKNYTFVVDRDWPDAQGAPLKESFRKSFHVLPPDDVPIDPKTWKVSAPAAGTNTALDVAFSEPLDQAMLERALWVTDTKGSKIAGTVTIGSEERSWQFKPRQAWQAGRYELVVDTTLEDLAGNRVGRPFEIDVLHPTQTKIESELVKLSFRVE